MSAQTADRPRPLARLGANIELLIAILLGLVSVATAYASFQGALYDSMMAGAYAEGTQQAAEGESLYLEANQQFMQDTQVFNQLSELQVGIDNGEPLAQEKYDTLAFQGVSEEFGAAIERAAEQTAADPGYFYSPLDDEEYQAFLFSPYSDKSEQAAATTAKGNEYNGLSDRLTLYTVLMAVSLFLLGIAALLKQLRTQYVLIATGTVISVVAIVLSLQIPFVGI